MERLISLFGLLVMIALVFALSADRRKADLRLAAAAVGLQFLLALLVLRTGPGQALFALAGAFFTALLNYVDAGSSFVFGEQFGEHFFAFKVLPTIIFFSALMGVLYHLGLVQPVVAAFAWVMRRTLGTSGAESLAAAANIFVGQTEAPLVVRPYVAGMTRSELMALMVGGFATIAGAVLAAFVGLGIDAGHLLAASVISAPAALMAAKVMQPEVETPTTLGQVSLRVERTAGNVIEAAANGTLDGLRLALNVGAMLIAALGLIALLDGVIGLLGRGVGYLLGTEALPWSLSAGLGYFFAPFAWLMGIEAGDCLHAGELLGKKMVINEFVSYVQLSQWMQPGSGVELSPRSVVILTYALCGFANFSSIGIQIGGIGGIAPERRGDLARLGFRAMLGGTLACFMTACVAGVLL